MDARVSDGGSGGSGGGGSVATGTGRCALAAFESRVMAGDAILVSGRHWTGCLVTATDEDARRPRGECCQ